MGKQKTESGEKVVCQNRKARHLYEIEETFEAGLELKGTEVKSLRQGQGSINEAFAQVKDAEAWIQQFHIPPYEQGNRFNADPIRPRKLLLHRREIDKLGAAVARKGYTLVPLRVYFARGRAKVLLGLARGKKTLDKREDMKRRDQQRDMNRALRDQRR
ncbi:MAG: SsrA-binding protein SmpB [bacterium]|nr:SsrA-binding protein SmpB [bacterium]